MSELDMNTALKETFSTGQGILQILPEMSDETLLFSIKRAIALCDGKPFTVVPPLARAEHVDAAIAAPDASVAFAYKQTPRWLAECPHCERQTLVVEDDCLSGAIFTATCCHCNNHFEARAD